MSDLLGGNGATVIKGDPCLLFDQALKKVDEILNLLELIDFLSSVCASRAEVVVSTALPLSFPLFPSSLSLPDIAYMRKPSVVSLSTHPAEDPSPHRRG